MPLGSVLRRWFGGGATEREAPEAEAVEYNGYTIQPAPRAQGGQYLTAGVIRKTFPEGEREQLFIRADTHVSHEQACRHALLKGRQLIDEQGDRLFRDDRHPA